MPTCSQAKIITNLESSELNRRLFRLVGEELNVVSSSAVRRREEEAAAAAAYEEDQARAVSQKSEERVEIKPSQARVHVDSSAAAAAAAAQRRTTKKHDCVGRQRGRAEQQVPATTAVPAARTSRRISIDDMQQQTSRGDNGNFQVLRLHKVPIVFGEVTMPSRRLAFNLLNSSPYSSQYRKVGGSSFMNNQMRINMLRSELNLNLMQQQRQLFGGGGGLGVGGGAGGGHVMVMASDGDEDDESASTPTTTSTTTSRASCSDKSSLSSDVNNQASAGPSNIQPRGSLLARKSFDYSQCLPIRYYSSCFFFHYHVTLFLVNILKNFETYNFLRPLISL